jgi:hypothetical protein
VPSEALFVTSNPISVSVSETPLASFSVLSGFTTVDESLIRLTSDRSFCRRDLRWQQLPAQKEQPRLSFIEARSFDPEQTEEGTLFDPTALCDLFANLTHRWNLRRTTLK